MSNEKRASVFITKFRMKMDKNGNDYLIGSIGMATATLRPHKTNQGEWNLFISESTKKPEGGNFNQSNGHAFGAGFSDDEIPF